MSEHSTKLSRDEMRAILLRHQGSMGEIAKSLGIRNANISHWLSDRSASKRVEKAVISKCKRILAEEAKSKESA